MLFLPVLLFTILLASDLRVTALDSCVEFTLQQCQFGEENSGDEAVSISANLVDSYVTTRLAVRSTDPFQEQIVDSIDDESSCIVEYLKSDYPYYWYGTKANSVTGCFLRQRGRSFGEIGNRATLNDDACLTIAANEDCNFLLQTARGCFCQKSDECRFSEDADDEVVAYDCRAPTTLPTTSPTTSPTKFPTASPTTSPTTSPTKFPTASPTTSPTKFPTASPTTSPTNFPTASPTTSPTNFPTVSPTVPPTVAPTSTSITQSPAPLPTGIPTDSGVTNTPTDSTQPTPTESPTKPPTIDADEEDSNSLQVVAIALSGVLGTLFLAGGLVVGYKKRQKRSLDPFRKITGSSHEGGLGSFSSMDSVGSNFSPMPVSEQQSTSAFPKAPSLFQLRSLGPLPEEDSSSTLQNESESTRNILAGAEDESRPLTMLTAAQRRELEDFLRANDRTIQDDGELKSKVDKLASTYRRSSLARALYVRYNKLPASLSGYVH